MSALEDVPAAALSQFATPLPEADQIRLTEFWSDVIAECGADLPPREVPPRPVRRARRVERQRASRLVRVVPSPQSAPSVGASGVAA